VKNIVQLALGIVTSVGGFLEVGSVATAAQAGAEYRFQLVWTLLLGTLCLIFLIEMAGRFAAVSQHTLPAAIRERFGFNVYLVVLVVVGGSSLLVLASEIGGVALALQLATGVTLAWWALPVGLVVWLLLWKGNFSVIEYGVSFLGLVAVVFLIGAVKLHPPLGELSAGVLPSLPRHGSARYWFIAVSILGATLTPYLFYFYSAGVVEDGWRESELGLNRMVASVGMSFGAGLSLSVLLVAAMVLAPRGIRLDRFEQAALLLTDPLGRWGFWLFATTLGIVCLGAALEVSLALAYIAAQGLGWNWGENVRPREAARFAAVYTAVLLVATVVAATGIDPLKLTLFSMALSSAILPLAVVPFLVLMNDRRYIGKHGNGVLANAVVLLATGLASAVAIVSIPLELWGS
jgi:Mn2+/Fe2+ NRAMP family transporter